MSWSEQVSDLLTPLEDFTALHAATIRRFGARAVDLAFPNPRFLSDPTPYRALAALAADAGPLDLRYSPFGGFTPVRRRLASALSRRHQLAYRWTDIVMTPGAAAALHVAFQSLFTPPDRIMLITPCWMDYPLYLTQLHLGYDLVPSAGDKHLDLDAIEAAWTPHTRALVISQPACPTGVAYTRTELLALADLLNRLAARHRTGRPPVLIADEAHRDHLWSGAPCPAPAGVYAETLTVYSCGKAWEMQGQRTGYLATSPTLTPGTGQLLLQGLRVSGHCTPTSLMQHVAAELADLRPDNTQLAALQHHARTELHAAGIATVDADATRFLYARAPGGDDLAFVTALAAQGVLAMPSTLFHEPGYFRLALNVPDLTPALALIAKAARNA